MQIVQRACNVLRSVVSNSPISIPSYALTKLWSLYKASKEVQEERFSGGLNRRAESGNFRVLHSRISVTRAALSLLFPLKWNFVPHEMRNGPWQERNGETPESGKRKASCVAIKNLLRLEEKSGIKPDVGRAIKEEATIKEILPLFNYSRSYAYSSLYSLCATVGNNEVVTLRIFYKRYSLSSVEIQDWVHQQLYATSVASL